MAFVVFPSEFGHPGTKQRLKALKKFMPYIAYMKKQNEIIYIVSRLTCSSFFNVKTVTHLEHFKNKKCIKFNFFQHIKHNYNFKVLHIENTKWFYNCFFF